MKVAVGKNCMSVLHDDDSCCGHSLEKLLGHVPRVLEASGVANTPLCLGFLSEGKIKH